MKSNGISKDRLSLIEKLQAFNDELQFLHRISQSISAIKPLPELLHEIMESSKRFMKAEASSLLLYDPEDRKLHFYVATGEKGGLFKQYSMEMGEGVAGWVAEHREPALIEDCYRDPRFNPEYDNRSDFKTRSMICLPLVRDERLLGVIQVINKTGKEVFDVDDLALFQILASQCAIAIENNQLTQQLIETETLERELELAREIQMNILPKSIHPYPDLDIRARIIPARQVGGDYYYIFQLNENQSLFVMADVCGKGFPAALIVATFNACLNSYLRIKQEQFELLGLVQILNRVLIESTTSTQFVTAWFGLYDHPAGRWTTVNAGHTPALYWNHEEGKIAKMEKGELFLGSMEVTYTCDQIAMGEKDVLVCYTDGVTEAWNVIEENYGDERLIQVILQYNHLNAGEILTAIENDVQQHVGAAVQSDDITCLVIKKK